MQIHESKLKNHQVEMKKTVQNLEPEGEICSKLKDRHPSEARMFPYSGHRYWSACKTASFSIVSKLLKTQDYTESLRILFLFLYFFFSFYTQSLLLAHYSLFSYITCSLPDVAQWTRNYAPMMANTERHTAKQ